MWRYVLRRILLAGPTLLAVLTIVFLIVRVAPGDPAIAVLGDYASDEAVQSLRERMGLDAPLWLQYVRYLADLLRGDLGKSLVTGLPVTDQILLVIPYTLELTLAAIAIGLALGVPLGVLTAVHRNRAIDYVGRIISLFGVSTPDFYLGLLFIYFFAIQLQLFSVVTSGNLADVGQRLHHLVLPALTLGLIETAYTTRLTRSVMLNVLNEDYVRTAHAKGLSDRSVLLHHALRSALVPLVSLVGLFTIALIGSSVLVEVVFSRPGLGKLMVGAMKQRDYTTLQSIMTIYAIIIVVLNLLVDLLYGVVDPRIRQE